MTDTYLRSLGFAPTAYGPKASQATFARAWRYQYGHLAKDGTPLFIEHPLGIDSCRLSAVAAPLTQQDIFAEISLHDRPKLEATIRDFYALHGGMGVLVMPAGAPAFRPFHRAE